MRRRRFIATISASVPIVGCLSEIEAAGPDTNESTENGTDTDTTDRSDTETRVAGGNTSPEAFSVGEPTDEVTPHELTVRNEGSRSRTVVLRITDVETDETLMDRSYSLGGEDVSDGLRGPAEYGVTVASPDAGTEHVTTVRYFDTCNDYRTTVTISADGTIASESIRTTAACGV